MPETSGSGFFSSLRFRYGLVVTGLLAVGGYFLWAEHEAHIPDYLPVILIFGLFMGLHFFMHGGHGGDRRLGGGDFELDGRRAEWFSRGVSLVVPPTRH